MNKYICHTKYLNRIPKIDLNRIYNKGLKIEHLSKYSKIGQEFLNKEINNYQNVVRIFETKDHDGYDEDGPKSNLWDIYIVFKNNNDLIYHNYHHEEWFCKNDEKKYNLYYKRKYDNKNKKWEKID